MGLAAWAAAARPSDAAIRAREFILFMFVEGDFMGFG
jgi:hypothetical protein